MKSKISYQLIVLTGFSILVLASNGLTQKQTGWEKNPEDKKEILRPKNNFFHSFGFIPFLNLFTLNYKITSDIDNTEYSTSTLNFSPLFIQYDLRYNLLNVRDFFSISVSSSPALAVCMSDYTTGIYRQLPIGLDLNFFMHSTFNNIQNAGFSFSGGLAFNHASSAMRSQEGPVSWKEYYGKFCFKFKKYKSANFKYYTTGILKVKNYYSYFGIQIGRGNADLTVNGVLEPHTNKSFRLIFGKILSY